MGMPSGGYPDFMDCGAGSAPPLLGCWDIRTQRRGAEQLHAFITVCSLIVGTGDWLLQTPAALTSWP